jgi:hypothetical protein
MAADIFAFQEMQPRYYGPIVAIPFFNVGKSSG